MLEPIKNKYKDAQVDVVCQDKTSIVFKNSPFVNKVIDYNRDRIRNDKLYKDSILSLLRNENYDVVLNTVFSREDVTDIISLGSGAKKIIGLNGDSCNISPEQLLINNQFYDLLITFPPGLTELQNHKMFLNELGIDAGNLNPVIWHDEYSENFAEEFFQKNNLKKENTVAFFPFAQHIHKEYPNYEEIIKHYQQFTFLIFGGNEKINDDKLKVWASNKNCINLVGKTTVLQMSSLIKRCGLYVGADSAGVHVACANNTKNVVILGGGHFGRFLPYSKFTSAVVKPMECYSCNWNCKYSRVKCVWDIDADLVIYAIDKTMFQNFDKPSVFFKYENDEQNSIIKQYIDAEKVNVFKLQQYGNKKQNIIIKKELPKISIVTPNYNQETFLEQTILSVLEQNYPNLEYIIMDGGSTDRSVDIIKKYAKYLTFWKSEKDKGQYYAVDEGFKLTTGEIMSWINSDDLYHAESFNKAADAFLNNKNVEWITGKPNNTNELGKGIYSYEYLPVYTRNKFLKGLYWAPFIMQEGTFWKRSLWNKAGGYISTDYKLAADLELWVRFFRYAELYTVNSYLGCFRVRDGQRSSEQLIEYMTEAEKIIHEEKKSSCGQYCENKKTQQELIIKSEPALQFSLGEVNDFFLTCYFLSTFQKKNRFDLSLEYFNRVKDFYKKDFDKNKYPKITIVITSVNEKGSFEKSIISVITQAYPNLELIVVTNDAEKECQNVIEKYNEYINESINLSSENLSDFVKAGLQKTTGEIFFWLNDDHFLEPGVLLKLFKKFSTHENSTGWTSKFKIIDHGNNCELILDSNGVTLENISNNTYEKEIYLPFFILSTGFAKRIMKNEGLFDLNFWVNKIGTEKFLGFDEILVSRFVNEVENNEANNENKVITNKRGMQMLQNEIENAIETGDYTKAIQLLQEVINNNPSDTEALNNLAVVLSILGEKDSAVRALNLVLQVDPQNEVALDNLKALAV